MMSSNKDMIIDLTKEEDEESQPTASAGNTPHYSPGSYLGSRTTSTTKPFYAEECDTSSDEEEEEVEVLKPYAIFKKQVLKKEEPSVKNEEVEVLKPRAVASIKKELLKEEELVKEEEDEEFHTSDEESLDESQPNTSAGTPHYTPISYSTYAYSPTCRPIMPRSTTKPFYAE
jgi:hypothetical protein